MAAPLKTLNDKHYKLIEVEIDWAWSHRNQEDKATEAGFSRARYNELMKDPLFLEALEEACEPVKRRLLPKWIAALERRLTENPDAATLRVAGEYLEKLSNVGDALGRALGGTLAERMEALKLDSTSATERSRTGVQTN